MYWYNAKIFTVIIRYAKVYVKNLQYRYCLCNGVDCRVSLLCTRRYVSGELKNLLCGHGEAGNLYCGQHLALWVKG